MSPLSRRIQFLLSITVLTATLALNGSVGAQNAMTMPRTSQACQIAEGALRDLTRDPGGIGGTGAPIGAQTGGIGGTGAPMQRAETGGIGGTGAPLERAEAGGIGGTGAPFTQADTHELGGTGIIGTVTGFGSVCVNGMRVTYDATTPVTLDGQIAHSKDLAVGQVVVVSATGRGTQVQAQSIAIVHTVVGPVTRVDTAARTIEVMGQTVRAVGGTAAVDAFMKAQAGDWVAVSGLPHPDGYVAASRISPVASKSGASLIGMAESGRIGGVMIGGKALQNGQAVRVSGIWDGTRLQAVRSEASPLNAQVQWRRMVVEGFQAGTTLHVGATKVTGLTSSGVPRRMIVESIRRGTDFEARRALERSSVRVLEGRGRNEAGNGLANPRGDNLGDGAGTDGRSGANPDKNDSGNGGGTSGSNGSGGNSGGSNTSGSSSNGGSSGSGGSGRSGGSGGGSGGSSGGSGRSAGSGRR